MTLDSWTTGDIITEININKRGIRRGTTTDRDALLAAELEVGDQFYNTTEQCTQLLVSETPNKWQSVRTFIGADSNEVSVLGTTPTQVKSIDWIKEPIGGFPGNVVFIVARIKTDDGGTTASLIVERDGGPSDELTLNTTSVTYETVVGSIDVSGDGDGERTLEFFLNDGGAGDTCSMKQLEVYGV